MRPTDTRIGRRLLLTIAMTIACGCSADKQVITSTPARPATVTVVDTTTDQTLWEKEIPVYCRLTLDFDAPGEVEGMKMSPHPATRMNWKLERPKTFPKFAMDKLLPPYTLKQFDPRYVWANVVRLRPQAWETAVKGRVTLPGSDVLMKMSLRPAPEFPPKVWPGLEIPDEPALNGPPATQSQPATKPDEHPTKLPVETSQESGPSAPESGADPSPDPVEEE